MSCLIRIYTVCHSVFDFRLKPLFASVDKSKFKNGRVQFRNSRMKGLIITVLYSKYLDTLTPYTLTLNLNNPFLLPVVVSKTAGIVANSVDTDQMLLPVCPNIVVLDKAFFCDF